MASCGRPDCCRQGPGDAPVAVLLAAFAPPTAGLLGGAGLAAWAGLAAPLAALAALAGMVAAAVLAGRRRRRRHGRAGMIIPLPCEESR